MRIQKFPRVGGALAGLTDKGVAATMLCFTQVEASTLGVDAGDLVRIRSQELSAAAKVLRIGRVALFVALFDYPDGGLADQPLQELALLVQNLIAEVHPDLLLVMDTAGITCHPDHRRATEAALAAASAARLPVLAWVVASGGVPAPGGGVRRPVHRPATRGSDLVLLMCAYHGKRRVAWLAHNVTAMNRTWSGRRQTSGVALLPRSGSFSTAALTFAGNITTNRSTSPAPASGATAGRSSPPAATSSRTPVSVTS